MLRNKKYWICFLILVIISCSRLDLIDPLRFEIAVSCDSVTFAEIGDFGWAGDAELKVAEMVKSWNPDFIVSGGDNNYPDGKLSTIRQNISQYYGDYIYNYDAPAEYQCNGKAFEERINRFFPTPGNHDARSRDGIVPYLNFFTLPGEEGFYKFTWGPVTFFSLNTANSILEYQKSWLDNELPLVTTPFKIVFFHHPPYSEGFHGSYGPMQWDFYSMGIDIVFAGHDHIYNKIEKIGEEGTYYIVNGLGGRGIHSCGVNMLPADKFKSFCYNDDYGAIRVCANKQKMILKFYSISSPALAIDSIIITKF